MNLPPRRLSHPTAALAAFATACAATVAPTLTPHDAGTPPLDTMVVVRDAPPTDAAAAEAGGTDLGRDAVSVDITDGGGDDVPDGTADAVIDRDATPDSGQCEGARCREAVAIQNANESVLVRLRDGTYIGWGTNNSGVLGTRTWDGFMNGPAVTPIVDGGRSLFLGAYFACLYDRVANAAPPRCWGINSQYAFSSERPNVITTFPNALESPGIPGQIRMLSSGPHPRLCVVLEDDSFWCRGSNEDDVLGLGAGVSVVSSFTRLPHFEPAARGPEFGRMGIVGVLRRDGTILLRGTGRNLGLGDGDESPRVRTAVVRNITDAIRFHLNFGGCARLRSGDVACWGAWVTPDGVVGPSPLPNPARGAVVLPWMRDSTDECVGSDFICGLFPGGRVRCAGHNNQGQTGAGLQSEREPPTDVPIPGVVTQLRCNASSVCVLTADHTVYCWGENVAGQAGQPRSFQPILRPTRVRWD